MKSPNEENIDWNLENPQDLLDLAIKTNSPYLIEKAIGAGALVNFREAHTLAYSPIETAILANHKEAVVCLIKNGVKLNVQEPCYLLPLSFAALNEKLDMVDVLIENGADVNQQSDSSDTPLMSAVHEQKSEVVSHLLKRGAKVNIGDSVQRTALHHAADYGNLTICQEILKYVNQDLSLNATDGYGKTPLHLAVENRRPDIVAALIKAGANVNAVNPLTGENPVHVAAKKEDKDTIRELLKGNATIEFKDVYDAYKPTFAQIALVNKLKKEMQLDYALKLGAKLSTTLRQTMKSGNHKADDKQSNHKTETPYHASGYHDSLTHRALFDIMSKVLVDSPKPLMLSVPPQKQLELMKKAMEVENKVCDKNANAKL